MTLENREKTEEMYIYLYFMILSPLHSTKYKTPPTTLAEN